MSEVKESKVLVGIDNYMEIKEMLNSSDEGSKVVALSILESANYEKSKLFILSMLLEICNVADISGSKLSALVQKEAPKLYTSIINDKEFPKGIEGVSFRSLYEFTKAHGTKEELLFLLNVCSDQLKRFLQAYGFDFLEYFDLDIKLKKT